ncbi:MAG: DNA-3-methyladenine glycosylase [Acidimicrobiales bacterium]
MSRLGRKFFGRDTLVVARDLLGRTLYHETAEGTAAGRIVEVEAYGGSEDPGSHAFRGMTRRNTVMFGPPGYLYVYFTYGMHCCANLVTEPEGTAGAVLLRAVEPTVGLELMAARRGTEVVSALAAGPGRLCRAFGIDLALNGADLVEGPVWVGEPRLLRGPEQASPRVGLRAGIDEHWRFFEDGPWTSRRGLARAPNRSTGASASDRSPPLSPGEPSSPDPVSDLR